MFSLMMRLYLPSKEGREQEGYLLPALYLDCIFAVCKGEKITRFARSWRDFICMIQKSGQYVSYF